MKTVLYADDNLEFVEIVRQTVERAGYDLLTAKNGREAVLICQEQNPDLVLLGVNMSDLDGFSAVRQMRDDGFNNPVIALSDSDSGDVRDRAYTAGCDECMQKNVDGDEVETVVLRFLGEERESS